MRSATTPKMDSVHTMTHPFVNQGCGQFLSPGLFARPKRTPQSVHMCTNMYGASETHWSGAQPQLPVNTFRLTLYKVSVVQSMRPVLMGLWRSCGACPVVAFVSLPGTNNVLPVQCTPFISVAGCVDYTQPSNPRPGRVGRWQHVVCNTILCLLHACFM